MNAPEKVGTVELLRHRLYPTELGYRMVEPGTYPVVRDQRSGRFSILFEGKANDRTEPSCESLGEGLFVFSPGHDQPHGESLTFPYGDWTPEAFADLLAHEVSTDGDPEQRLRFRVEVPA